MAKRRRGRPGFKKLGTQLLEYVAGGPPPILPKRAWGPERMWKLLKDIHALKSKGKTDREIAKALGMSYSNFRRRRQQALKVLIKIRSTKTTVTSRKTRLIYS